MTDLRRWLFFIPAIFLIAAVLMWLLLRGDRCPFCDGELSNK